MWRSNARARPTGWASARRVAACLYSLATRVSLALVVLAGAAQAQGFQTSAPHAILIDVATGAVLFEKAADDPIAPASMAKIMTAAVLFEEIRQGRLKLDDEFGISENAWRKGGAPSGGSAMFAQLGSRVKIVDLIQGIVVQSGNDASIAVAEGIAGSEDNFANLMTKRARELGLTKSVFRNATGLGHPEQKTTARELAKLSQHVIETYPDLYKYFGQREFTWNKIRQQNRNPLIAMDIGADGLKTGYIEESGYGLVGSAVQNDQRLIVVVAGLKTARDRATEARKLLDWGFRSFEARMLFAAGEEVGDVRVYGGEKGSVAVAAKVPVKVLMQRGSSEKLVARIVYMGPLRAPVEPGQEVARLRVTRGDTQALDLPLYSTAAVARGSLSQRAFDGLIELGVGLARRAFAKI
ncbi:D-alanyl-D-alanine carboxypeptidase family protein [Chelatococcus sp. SYSU_G07232]|uniref:serine-type D-Ala-D-Ala carboxypeptidase n=1 Tax=Chelatococcus albus TaxID=3047466 RepID=A0ABT7ADW6_9HYPH|nr:D-alanyl-D-alanine carboxypeptidase family protein [Chelatococcus sp. SYSU_G07232]MDJ1156791.1 D-alanyl-D-alanine carboxypeptidase family protein [Chelatococcus sp. SYSU_G07232]